MLYPSEIVWSVVDGLTTVDNEAFMRRVFRWEMILQCVCASGEGEVSDSRNTLIPLCKNTSHIFTWLAKCNRDHVLCDFEPISARVVFWCTPDIHTLNEGGSKIASGAGLLEILSNCTMSSMWLSWNRFMKKTPADIFTSGGMLQFPSLAGQSCQHSRPEMSPIFGRFCLCCEVVGI